MKLDEFLSKFDGVEPEGDQFLALCPGHDDHKPSLVIGAAGRRPGVVLECRAQCDINDVLKGAGLTFDDLSAVDTRELPKLTPRASASDDARAAARVRAMGRVTRLVKEAASNEALRPMLEDRFGIPTAGLDFATADALGIGYDEARLWIHARRADGRYAFAQGRALDPADKLRWKGDANPKGEEWDAAGFVGPVKGSRPVVVTEGMSDALTVAALDVADVVAIRGAKNASKVTQVADALRGRTVYVAGDGDEAGRKFAVDVARTLAGVADVRLMQLPEGMDVSDVRQRDPERFREALTELAQNAQPYQEEALEPKPERPRKASDIATVKASTDVARARVVLEHARRTGRDIAWTRETEWMFWDGAIWHVDAETRVRRMFHEVGDLGTKEVDELFKSTGAAPSEDVEEARERSRTRAQMKTAAFHSTKHIARAMAELPSLEDVEQRINDFDANPDLLQVANGVVDLRTGELREPRREDRITRRLDVRYDPNAQAPQWEKFLTEVFVTADGDPDPDVADFMRRVVGYGITGHTREQVFVVNWGTGANGKSVFTETLERVFGPITETTAFETFEERQSGGIPNDIAALKGARLVLAAEGSPGKPMHESLIKRLSGEDTITARFMRKEFFSFRPQFLVMLSTNYKPQFRGQDEGLWRRVVLVPWRRYFAPHERDKGLRDRLIAEEAEGILAWAVRGAVEWYRRGLDMPESVSRETRTFRKESDRLGDFIAARVLVTGDQDDVVKASDVWKAYREWCLDEGETHGYRRNLFLAMLRERPGFSYVHEYRGRGIDKQAVFVGVRLPSASEREALERKMSRPLRIVDAEPGSAY